MLPVPDFLILPTKKERRNERGSSFDGSITIQIIYDSISQSIERDTIVMELLHQMVHIYCSIFEIKDTTRQGRYHNRNFRQVAQDFGLIIQQDPTYGAKVIGCQDQVRSIQNRNLPDFYDEVLRIKELIQNSKEQTHTYICPICKRKVTGDKETKVICGYCYMEMIAYLKMEV